MTTPAAVASPVPNPAQRQSSLRTKSSVALAAVAAYFIATGVVLSMQRDQMVDIVGELDNLYQVEATLGRASTFASQALLRINDSYFNAEPRQVIDALQLDVESIAAGVGPIAAAHPRVGVALQRLQASLASARASAARSNLIELRGLIHELSRELDQISREVRARHESMWSGYRATYDSVTLIAALLFFLGLAIFGGIVTVFFRRLAWDLQALSERAMDVVRGYRGEPLRVTRHDEVGALMDSVNRMQHTLREREQQIEVARQQRFHQEKMAAIGSLAAAVAHEINNPIAAIEGVAQTLGEQRPPGPGDDVPCEPELILAHTRRI